MESKSDRVRTGSGAARSDAALAVAARDGNKRAFVEIVARHQGMVTGVALAILRDFAASEDAAQEAFLTAWKKIGELREPGKLRAWLASIARSTALMHLRKRRPEEHYDAEADPAEAGENRPDESAASREESALVLSALDALPETYRLPLVLFYREEKSVRAVAETLELSEDAVKQRLARGRDMLRDRMAGVIDSVLGRTLPTAVFTMTIAAAIGALSGPGAVAASVFSTASAGTAAAAGASTSATSAAAAASAPAVTSTATLTTMSIAKLSLTAATVAAICVPVGYTARLATEPDRTEVRAAASGKASKPGSPVSSQSQPELPDSPLMAEWMRLRARYGSSPEELERLHGDLEALDDPFRRRAFLSALIAEWAERDPASGMVFFRENKDAPYWWQRELFVQEAIKADPNAAIASLKASGDGWKELARDHLVEFAKRAPGIVPGLAAQLPEAESAWDTKVRDAFAIIAGRDLAGSRAAAEALAGPSRVQALSGVAMAWAEKNGADAFAWAKQQTEGEERHEVMRAALIGWAKTDPAAALDRIEQVPTGGDDMRFASSTGAQVLRAAAEADFEATVRWLVDHPGNLGQADLIGLMTAVQPRLVADPTGFLSQAQANGSLPLLMRPIGTALLNDASGRRLEVWEWLRDAPDVPGTSELRGTVLNGLGWREPRVAMKLVDELPAGEERSRLVQRTAMAILNGGSNAGVLEYLLDDVSPEWRSQLLRAGFLSLRPERFQGADPWLERFDGLDAEGRRVAVPSLARSWASDDPEAAAAWVASLEKPTERAIGTRAVSTHWAQSDAYSAGEWVAGMPPGEPRDTAAAGLVSAIAQSDPGEAWEWVESIGTTEHRLAAAMDVLRPMMERDLDAATQWLGRSGLPATDKEELARRLENGTINRRNQQ